MQRVPLGAEVELYSWIIITKNTTRLPLKCQPGTTVVESNKEMLI